MPDNPAAQEFFSLALVVNQALAARSAQIAAPFCLKPAERDIWRADSRPNPPRLVRSTSPHCRDEISAAKANINAICNEFRAQMARHLAPRAAHSQ